MPIVGDIDQRARPLRPWIALTGVNAIVEARGDGYVTREICRHDGSTMAAFYREENAKLIAEAGTVWYETGMTPRQLADEVNRLTLLLDNS